MEAKMQLSTFKICLKKAKFQLGNAWGLCLSGTSFISWTVGLFIFS